MNTTTPPEILDEVKNLITYSINNRELENSNYQLMHRAIIKKYFEGKNISIDYVAQSVTMQIPVGKRRYTKITFECQDLERFLKSCIKKDDKSMVFYENLLSHYNITSAA